MSRCMGEKDFPNCPWKCEVVIIAQELLYLAEAAGWYLSASATAAKFSSAANLGGRHARGAEFELGDEGVGPGRHLHFRATAAAQLGRLCHL